MAKRLELLKDAVPSTARVGVLVNPDDPTDSAGLSLLPTTARALNLEVRVLEVRSPVSWSQSLPLRPAMACRRYASASHRCSTRPGHLSLRWHCA